MSSESIHDSGIRSPQYVTEGNCEKRHRDTNRWFAVLTSAMSIFIVAAGWSIIVGYQAISGQEKIKTDAVLDVRDVTSKLEVRTAIVDERQKAINDKLGVIDNRLEKINERQEAMYKILRENHRPGS